MKKLNQFSGRLLSAFLTLAECEQFKLAAERFNVSQSAFSQMIARLESQLGTRLFDRDTREVSLTPEGRLLVPMAQALSADVHQMYANLRDHAERRKGKVALAALPSLASDWLPRILVDFRKRYPGIAVQFYDEVIDTNIDLLRRGAVDFAITARVNTPDEFDIRLLFEEPLFFICLPSHPFANQKSLNLKALAGCQYIHSARSVSGSIWHWIEPHMRDFEFVDTGFEVGHLSTLAGLIASGIGVSITSAFALPQFYRVGLCAVRLSDKGLRRPLYVVTRRGKSLSAAALALLDMVAESPPEQMLGRYAVPHEEPAAPASPAKKRTAAPRSAASKRAVPAAPA